MNAPDKRKAYICPICNLGLSRFAAKRHRAEAHKPEDARYVAHAA